MNLIEAINRLKTNNCQCEICNRHIVAEDSMVVDAQGKQTIIICTECYRIRRAFANEGLILP